MSFVFVIFMLLWLVAWPILSFAYFKVQTSDTPIPTEYRLESRDVQFGPKIVDDKTKLVMKIGPTSYILDEDEVTQLVRRLRGTQLTVKTMNEAQALT